VALQMAARLGKSMTAQGLMVAALEHDPDVGMIAMSTKTLLEQTIEDKYYRILEATNATRNKIPPPHDRNKQEVSFGRIKIYGAWSGSTTTLADKPPKYKHAGEIDKWDMAASREADSLDLFMERGIEIPDRKSIIESTPDLEHTSRINKYLNLGTNCRFKIPCPKCSKYIQLIPGDGKAEGGVRFDKLDGQFNQRHASITARYVCQLCGEPWGDEYRKPAIREGLWVPEGCHVERYGKKKAKTKIVGTVSGDPEIASFQLSRLYAPTFKFGDIARQIAKCLLDPTHWQTTRNSWFGITHSFRSSVMSWEDTAARLSTIEYRLQTAPKPVQFLTCAIDVQEDHFVFVVIGWARHGVGYMIDYGTAWTESELRTIVQTKYKHLDGGPDIGISITLMDSGEGTRQDEIIDICQRLNKAKGPWVWPSKGSSSGLSNGKAYKKQKFEEMGDKKKKHGRLHGLTGFFHISVNTPWTQTWLNRALFFLDPGQAKSIAIPVDVTEDEDLISQMINEKPEGIDTTTGHGKQRWVVVDETIPWDFRDCCRYCRAAADLFVRSAWLRLPAKRRISTDEKPKKAKKKRSKKASPAMKKTPPNKESGSGFVRRPTRKRKTSPFVRGG
jgi:phage terminase large subunit GpA-like protein